MAWMLCGTIEECWVAVIEAVGSHHTHLGPVSKEYMVFKSSNSKRVWRLDSTVENYFPEKQQPQNGYQEEDTMHLFVSPFNIKDTLCVTGNLSDKSSSATVTCPNRCR